MKKNINVGFGEILNFKSLLKVFYVNNYIENKKIKIIKLENFINMLVFSIIERIEVDLKSNILNKYDIKEVKEIMCSEKSIEIYLGDNSYIDSYILDIIIDEIEKD